MILLGLAVVLIGLSAELVGLAGSDGTGWVQLLVTLVGLLFVVGAV